MFITVSYEYKLLLIHDYYMKFKKVKLMFTPFERLPYIATCIFFYFEHNTKLYLCWLYFKLKSFVSEMNISDG